MPEAKLTRGEYIVSGDAFNRYATGGVVEGVTCSADEPPPMLSSCLYGSSPAPGSSFPRSGETV